MQQLINEIDRQCAINNNAAHIGYHLTGAEVELPNTMEHLAVIISCLFAKNSYFQGCDWLTSWLPPVVEDHNHMPGMLPHQEMV
jgi:hypothetical protein